jgi:iron complex outermembrane recepter protein
LQLLSYADQVLRYEAGQHDEFTLTNYDFEGQYTFDVAGWNHFLLGAGDRVAPYNLVPRIGTENSLEWHPTRRTINLLCGMVQDTISAADELNLILGLKLENDPYCGLSPLPGVRLAWKRKPDLLIWAAVSHAVRAPTTFDVDVREYSGSTLLLNGNPYFQLNAFELGDGHNSAMRLYRFPVFIICIRTCAALKSLPTR